MTSEGDGPLFSRTFALRRRGWDHHMVLQAAFGSEALLTAQARSAGLIANSVIQSSASKAHLDKAFQNSLHLEVPAIGRNAQC